MSFDFDEQERRLAEAQRRRTRQLLETIKQELGQKGCGIHIDGSAEPHASDPLGLATVRYPSLEVKEQFLQLLRQRLDP
jgi:hypothetical protein